MAKRKRPAESPVDTGARELSIVGRDSRGREIARPRHDAGDPQDEYVLRSTFSGAKAVRRRYQSMMHRLHAMGSLSAREMQIGLALHRDYVAGRVEPYMIEGRYRQRREVPATPEERARAQDHGMEARERCTRALMLVGPIITSVLWHCCIEDRMPSEHDRQKGWRPGTSAINLREGLKLLGSIGSLYG